MELASLLAQSASEALVVDEENHPLGRVRRDTIVDVLMGVSPKQVRHPQDSG
jgi:hypothetical protein